MGKDRTRCYRPFRRGGVVTSIEPTFLVGEISPGTTITVYGENLDSFPDELVLCTGLTIEDANEHLNGTFGSMGAMPVKDRDENHITFYRSLGSTFHTDSPYYPYYITSPETPPRVISYEF